MITSPPRLHDTQFELADLDGSIDEVPKALDGITFSLTPLTKRPAYYLHGEHGSP